MKNLQDIIDSSRCVVFFGGAGVSTESNIPDFRSGGGLYSQTHKYPPETVLSHGFFYSHTEEFYDFYREKMLTMWAKPNKAHLKLAEMEKSGKLTGIVTQNIDGLHQKAGSKRVFELHGSVHRNYCTGCGAFYAPEYIQSSAGVPKCPKCGGVIKPDVVLYDEPLDERTIARSIEAIESADTMIVAGTSLTVYPAAGLIRYFKGRELVLINRDETDYDNSASLVLHGNVGEILGEIRV